MSSLSVHLRLPEDHSGLPFHPGCPVCRRERLAGSLEGDEIVSRRTQAALTVGLLAFSGIGAPAAVAAGPDEDMDGSAEVVASPNPGEAELDETTTGWTDGGTAPSEDDPAALAPEAEDGSMEAAPREAAEEALIEDAVEEPAAVEQAPEPVAPAVPPAEVPTAVTEPPASGDVSVDTAERSERDRSVKPTKPAVQPRVIAAPAPVVAPAATNAVTVRVAAGTNQNTVARASSNARFHVVQRGESLWSIATDRLGDGVSVTQVSREVSRLWELNAERIGTGSPDLLYAGTRLRLR